MRDMHVRQVVNKDYTHGTSKSNRLILGAMVRLWICGPPRVHGNIITAKCLVCVLWPAMRTEVNAARAKPASERNVWHHWAKYYNALRLDIHGRPPLVKLHWVFMCGLRTQNNRRFTLITSVKPISICIDCGQFVLIYMRINSSSAHSTRTRARAHSKHRTRRMWLGSLSRRPVNVFALHKHA